MDRILMLSKIKYILRLTPIKIEKSGLNSQYMLFCSVKDDMSESIKSHTEPK